MSDDEAKGLAATEVPSAITQAVSNGAIVSMGDLVAALAPPPAISKVGAVPLPAVVSEDEKVALERLPEVYGSVVPTERRELEPTEITSLIGERGVLKTVESLVKRRLDDISLTVLNHNDVDFEEDPSQTEGVLLGPDGKPFITAKGHVVRKARFRGDDPSLATLFSVETRKGSPSVSPSKFQELADDPAWENASHQDYLACTRQERVWDENKAMIHLRANPHLLVTLREAMTTSSPSVSVYERANK